MVKSEQDLRDDLSADCVALLHSDTFYGHILVAIQKTFDHRLPAVAGVQVSSHVLLRINPERYFAEEDGHRVGILKHELLHVILKHHLRGRNLTNVAKANVAADLAINPLVGRDCLPAWTIWPGDLDLPEGETFEWYYDNLPEPEGEDGGEGAGGGTQGQDQDDDGDGGGEDEEQNPYLPQGKRTVDDHDWQSAIPEGQEGLAETTIDRLIKSAERQCGDLPGNIKDLIMYKSAHIVPWQTIVRRFFGSTRATLDWTKKRLSKRYGTRPGTRFKERATIVFGIDSSGSISDDELNTFCTEVGHASRTGLVDIWVVICDAAIHHVIHPYRKITMVEGRGGTDFRPVFDWALDNSKHPPVDGVIYLTDGYGPAPEHRPKIQTLWVLTSDGQWPCDWGQRLRLPDLNIGV